LDLEGGAATDLEQAAALASAEGGVAGYLVACTFWISLPQASGLEVILASGECEGLTTSESILISIDLLREESIGTQQADAIPDEWAAPNMDQSPALTVTVDIIA